MKQQERQARSRAEILQAAMEEFGSRDYDQVNMESICKNHGISKGMMYHYYSNKDELFLLCVEETFRALQRYLEQDMAQDHGEDTLQSIQNYFMTREYFFRQHPRHQRIFENAMLRPPEHLQGEIRTLREPLRQLNRTYLERLANRMPLRPGVEREQAARYLESMEAVFRDIIVRYRADQTIQDLHTLLTTATEVMDLFLFGVLRQEPAE